MVHCPRGFRSAPALGATLLLTAAGLLPLAGAPPVGGGPIETFEGKPAFAVEPGLDPGNACAVVGDAGKAGNHVLKLNWPSQSGSHVACNYQEAKLPVADAPGKYKVSALVNTEQVGAEVHQLALRVIDQNNEVFQLVAELKNAGSPGWSEVSWVLDTSHPDTGNIPSWGDTVNGVVDLPVRLLGFALPFGGGSTPGGALLLDNVAVTKLAAK